MTLVCQKNRFQWRGDTWPPFKISYFQRKYGYIFVFSSVRGWQDPR